jgi:uncharacterized membrane protein
VSGIALFDLIAFFNVTATTEIYTFYSERVARQGRRQTLMRSMDAYRDAWMVRMTERENRVVDTTLVTTLSHSVTFLASTSVLVVAGLLAVLGALDTAIGVVSGFTYAVNASRELWEIKLLMMIVIFVYAFFKFTWSLRLNNYAAIMIGAAPLQVDAAYGKRAGRVASMAGKHFNRGLRAYYFGLAGLSWFLHPGLFVLLTAWVIWVLYRREFLSDSLEALGDPLVQFAERTDSTIGKPAD